MKYDSVEEEEEAPRAPQADLIKSYLAFGARAVRRHRLLMLITFLVVSSLVLGVASLLPKSYYSEIRLVLQDPGALSTDNRADPFAGAETTILRQNTLESIVKQTGLVHTWESTLTPLQRLKNRVLNRSSAALSEKDKTDVLVGMLGNRYSIDTWGGKLTISIEWPEPKMAARLVEAAEQTYLQNRHGIEVASLGESIAILEKHAAKERSSIVEITERIQNLRKARREQKSANLAKLATPEPTASSEPAPRVVRRAPAPVNVAADPEIVKLKVLLDAKENAIAELERERNGRLAALRGQERELLLRYTEVHPEVIRVRQNMESIARETTQVTLLRGETDTLKTQIADRTAALTGSAAAGGAGVVVSAGPTPAAGITNLPPAVLSLMDEGTDDIDPTITSQFQYAVSKYSGLTAEID
ncbi:MAG TPA: hypothetical protein VGK73_08005, partial [Polyangiaceae bacterium]